MTAHSGGPFSNLQHRSAAAVLQLVLASIFVFGVVTGRPKIALTGGATLAVTFLPALLEHRFDYSLSPGLLLWLTLSVTIHTFGSMGLYDQFVWYDSIAHTVSAMVVAGIGYASFRAVEVHSDDIGTDNIDMPELFRSVFILVFVLAAGVFWEVLEFGLGIFTVYGVNDIVTDLIFNTLGAVIVAIWGTRHVSGVTGFFLERLRSS
jgi:CubicO group peptidase (beta-lactamase class C family)